MGKRLSAELIQAYSPEARNIGPSHAPNRALARPQRRITKNGAVTHTRFQNVLRHKHARVSEWMCTDFVLQKPDSPCRFSSCRFFLRELPRSGGAPGMQTRPPRKGWRSVPLFSPTHRAVEPRASAGALAGRVLFRIRGWNRPPCLPRRDFVPCRWDADGTVVLV
jgi:hypothetical protein